MNVDSSQVLTRLQTGGAVELAALFERLRTHLRRMVDVQLGDQLQSRLDASDIIQETFLRASEGLSNYLESPLVHPVVWIRLTGKRIVAEAARFNYRQKRSPAREQAWVRDDDGPMTERLSASLSSVWTHLAKVELVGRVKEALGSLSELDREVIEMRHLEALSLPEIAASLETTVDAAKKRYYRALQRLRDCIDDPS